MYHVPTQEEEQQGGVADGLPERGPQPPVSRSRHLHVFMSSYPHITVTSYHHIMMVWSNDKLLHGSTAPPSHQRCLECMQVQYSSDEYFSCVYDQIFISRDLSWRFPIDWSFSAIIIKINDIITRRVDGCKQCQLYVILTNNHEYLETRQAHLKWYLVLRYNVTISNITNKINSS